MSLLNSLVHFLEGNHPQAPQAQVGRALAPQLQQHMQPMQHVQPLPQPQAQGQVPDITYNPNPNVDIPYSAHTPQLAQLGNLYTANPTAPQFRGIDPGLFGYPADGPGGVNPNDMFRVLQGTPTPLGNPLQHQGSLPYGGLQGGYDRAAQPLRPGQIPFNQSNFRDTQIKF